MHTLVTSKPVLLLAILLMLFLFTILDLLFLRETDEEKLEYVLSSINVSIPISMLILLITKNYALFYILNFSNHSVLVSYIFLISVCLEIYFSTFLILGISKAYNLSVYKNKNEILNMQYELQLNHFNQLYEYQSDIRRISHDIHNHKSILYNLIQSKNYDDALVYLNDYGKGFSSNKYEIFTYNKILNAMFISKKDICSLNSIDLELNIDIPEDFGVSDFDLCVIVGNLIDNAIEACLKVCISDNRFIVIKAMIINNNFVFEIKNSFHDSIHIDNYNKIITSKSDKLYHGLGLSNVKSAVNKYNGTYEVSFENNIFSTFIMIPSISNKKTSL